VLTKDNYSQPAAALSSESQRQVAIERSHDSVSDSVVISVVIPTYNAADCLKPLYDRLSRVLLQLTDKFEILFIEDCGGDHSWDTLVEMSKRLPYIRAVKLSRNFGQQAAITAGLTICKGKWVVVMDCDLQDPPEDIVRMWRKAEEGYDLVLARRIGRKQSALRRLFGKAYFGLLSAFCMSRIDGDFSSFTLISRKVVDAFLSFSDRNRHYMMIIQWLGFERAIVEYQQGERFAGKSSYSLFSLLKLAAQGFLFQTTVLLQVIVAMGFVVSCLGVIGFAWTLWNYCIQAHVLPGWTSVIDTLLILGGFILISIGVLGLYIGEIFDQVKQRPLFLVSKEVASS
jgi:polyisoprenyl-phosphate glycosyltransferase